MDSDTATDERARGVIEAAFSFPIEIGQVLDFDIGPDNVAVTLQGFNRRHILTIGGRTCEMPPEWTYPDYPHLRRLSGGRHLLIDTAPNSVSGENGWILDSNGHTLRRFHIGAGAIDVVSLGSFIAVGFHPNAALAHGYSASSVHFSAISIFTQNGVLIGDLNQMLSDYGYYVDNISCMAPVHDSEFIFVPETLTGTDDAYEFPILRFSLKDLRMDWTLSPFRDPMAIADAGDRLLIYSPAGADERVFSFDPVLQAAMPIGHHPDIYRGLRGGRFLAQLGESEYAVVKPELPPLPPRTALSTQGLQIAPTP